MCIRDRGVGVDGMVIALVTVIVIVGVPGVLTVGTRPLPALSLIHISEPTRPY